MFTLKKFIAAMCMPSTLCLILICLAVLAYLLKQKRTAVLFSTVAVVGLLIGAHPITKYAMTKVLEDQYSTANSQRLMAKYHSDIQWIVVLGAAHEDRGHFPLTSKVSGSGQVRLIETFVQSKKLPEAKIIVSGYRAFKVNRYSYAQMASQYLTHLGVDKQRLVVLAKPTDTDDEAREVAKVVGDDKVLLITTAKHMPRAMALFQSQGVDVIPWSVDHEATTKPSWVSMPSLRWFKPLDSAVHEYLGILWSYLNKDIKTWPL